MRYKQEIDLRPIKFVVKEIKAIGAAEAYEFDEKRQNATAWIPWWSDCLPR